MKRPYILIATKDESLAALAATVGRETGHNRLRAEDIPDTWALFKSEGKRISLAIIDLDLDEHGLSFLHLLVHSRPDFSILALTHAPEISFESETMSQPAFDYLIKPVAADELRHKIKELCGECEFAEEAHLFQF